MQIISLFETNTHSEKKKKKRRRILTLKVT